MSREELDNEFMGNEWEVGYTFGTQGYGMAEALKKVVEEMERTLTKSETKAFCKGCKEGGKDRAAWENDMAEGYAWEPIELPY